MKNNNLRSPELTKLVKTLSVVHGKVTLASGREADLYVDMRRAALHHEATPLVGYVAIDLLKENGLPIPEIGVVGGLTMGADPTASVMLHVTATRGLDLDAFVVRKIAKGHGMKHQTEGPEVAGKRVMVLGDTSTAGGSPLQAVSTLEAAGTKAVAMAMIVDRDTGTRQRIEEAGYPYFAALRLTDLGLP